MRSNVIPLFFSWWILLSHPFTLNMDRKYPPCWAQTKDKRSERKRLTLKSLLNQYVISLAVFWDGHCHWSQQTDASMNWINNDEWRIADSGSRGYSQFFYNTWSIRKKFSTNWRSSLAWTREFPFIFYSKISRLGFSIPDMLVRHVICC